MLFVHCPLLHVAETYHHYDRGKKDPADVPELVGPDAHHLLNTIYKLLCPKYPRNGDSLEETNPQK
jgi:hypothetical protein